MLMAVSFLPYGFYVTSGRTGRGIRRTSDSGRAARLPTLALDRSRYEPKEIIMKPVRHLRRLAAALAGLACTWLGIAVVAPAAFAASSVPPPSGGSARITLPPEPPGWNKHPPLPSVHIHQPIHQAPVPVPVHTVVAGGMSGWQIALIAIGAALLAATAAVLAYRAWTGRRHPVTAAAEPSAAADDARLPSAR
jgi:hypothetical protein